jgi:hypothetical protein
MQNTILLNPDSIQIACSKCGTVIPEGVYSHNCGMELLNHATEIHLDDCRYSLCGFLDDKWFIRDNDLECDVKHEPFDTVGDAFAYWKTHLREKP